MTMRSNHKRVQIQSIMKGFFYEEECNDAQYKLPAYMIWKGKQR